MSDLPARLEAATEGSRELDLEVLNAIGRSVWYWRDRESETITCDRYGPDAIGNPVCGLERFTGSSDDALRIVDGADIVTTRSEKQDNGVTFHTASVRKLGRVFRGASVSDLPLAICAAALRSRLL